MPVDLPSGMRCFLDYQDFFHNANALTSPFCKFIALLSPDGIQGEKWGHRDVRNVFEHRENIETAFHWGSDNLIWHYSLLSFPYQPQLSFV